MSLGVEAAEVAFEVAVKAEEVVEKLLLLFNTQQTAIGVARAAADSADRARIASENSVSAAVTAAKQRIQVRLVNLNLNI